MSRLRIVLANAIVFAVLFGSSTAYAAVMVLGGGLAQQCYEAAREAVTALQQTVPLTGSRIGLSPVEVCTLAIQSETLSTHARAGTYNNRGVLLFVEESFEEALNSFDIAVGIDSSIAEAHVNRGASLIALHRWADGVAALDVGLELQPSEAEKAYYNRAIAHEELGNVRAAYFDYLKASELKPDWEGPRLQLTRFTVRKKTEAEAEP